MTGVIRAIINSATPPKRRRLPVFVQGRVAQWIPCAYGVQCGSVPVVSGPEENSECPWTQPPRPRGYPVRRWWMERV